MTRFNVRNRLAQRLYSAPDSDDNAERMTDMNTSIGRVGGTNFERRNADVSKQANGERRAEVPLHIYDPVKGEPRPFNPFDLRQLANSETIRAVEGTILGDIDAVPWSVVPVSDDADPPESVIDDAERLLEDPNPNPESFTDINRMLVRDLLEIGNCAASTTPMIDDRQAEALPLDAATFTADWNEHRILQGFYQYPQGNDAKWGDPISFERDEVMWSTYNPSTPRAGFYGLSPVEQVERAINIMGGLVEKEITELEEGMPSGLIALVGDSWTQQNYDNFKTYWNQNVKGSQMKHPIAEGDAKFVPFSMTYKELQVLDRQQWYAKLVGSVFQVPMSETGLAIGEEMTRATDISQRQRYKQKALQSLLTQIEDLWTYQFLHEWISEDIRLSFDVGRDLMEKDTLSQIHDRQLSNGSRTINEVREERGDDPVSWGDEPFSIKQYAKQTFPDPDTEPDIEGEPEYTPSQGQGQGQGQSSQQTTEQANQNALDEGMEQTVGKSFRSGATWMPADVPLSVLKDTDEPASETELRPNVDAEDEGVFLVTDDDVDALAEDLEQLVGSYITEVMDQVRGNQDLLRLGRESDPAREGGLSVEKSINELIELVRDAIGVEFTEDVTQALNEHKHAQVEQGVNTILQRIEQSGVEASVEAEPLEDRVSETIRNRTMDVVKPITRRLESDLREALVDAWQQGWSITQTEQAIESVSDAWTGYQTERLARDQLGKASKQSRNEAAKETSDEVGGWNVTWHDSDDDRVRDSHEHMDGTTIPASESFTVNYTYDGGPPAVEEEYPGASKWGIQCRCSQKFTPRGLVETDKRLTTDEPRTIEFDDGEMGAIAEIKVEDFEWQGEQYEASTDNFAYLVGRESGGSTVLRADEFTTGGFDGESPTKAEIAELNEHIEKVVAPGDDPETGFAGLPEGWDRSSVLQAWASLGGSFTSCVTQMSGEVRSPERLCAAYKDTVLMSEEWRNGGS